MTKLFVVLVFNVGNHANLIDHSKIFTDKAAANRYIISTAKAILGRRVQYASDALAALPGTFRTFTAVEDAR
jgi:hypothetical protein